MACFYPVLGKKDPKTLHLWALGHAKFFVLFVDLKPCLEEVYIASAQDTFVSPQKIVQGVPDAHAAPVTDMGEILTTFTLYMVNSATENV